MERRKRQRRPERQRSAHPVLNMFLLALTAIVFIMGAYGFRMYADTKNTVNRSFLQLSGRTDQELDQKVQATKPISFLLLGTDTGALGRKEKLANSDTIMVVTINPKKKRTTMISIPRDTMAQIQDGDNKEIAKINSAFMRGGSDCAVRTVEKLLNINIDYYVTINMGGLAKIVDAVGGVDVNVPFDWSDTVHDGGTFKKGPAHLDGKQALQFARMRYQDPDGDYGRQRRQQQVISAIVKSVLSASTLVRYKSLLDSLEGNLQMNLDFDDLMNIANGYRDSAKTIRKRQLKAVGAWIGDASYQIASTAELQKMSDMIRGELGQASVTLDNENVRQNNLNVNFDWTSGDNPEYYLY